MNRKDFFRRFVMGLAGLTFLKQAEAEPGKKEIILSHPLVAGFQYYNGAKTQSSIRVKDSLLLVRQPQNPYDKNAIEVFYGETKLGYIPKRENKLIARMMDQGLELKSRVIQINLDQISYERVRIEIFFEPGAQDFDIRL